MPTYTLRDDNTGDVWDEFMKVAEMDELLAHCPHLSVVPTAVASIDPIRSGITRPSRDFRERLGEIKTAHTKIFTKSTINTQ